MTPMFSKLRSHRARLYNPTLWTVPDKIRAARAGLRKVPARQSAVPYVARQGSRPDRAAGIPRTGGRTGRRSTGTDGAPRASGFPAPAMRPRPQNPPSAGSSSFIPTCSASYYPADTKPIRGPSSRQGHAGKKQRRDPSSHGLRGRVGHRTPRARRRHPRVAVEPWSLPSCREPHSFRI